jgi:hypothetical protein
MMVCLDMMSQPNATIPAAFTIRRLMQGATGTNGKLIRRTTHNMLRVFVVLYALCASYMQKFSCERKRRHSSNAGAVVQTRYTLVA